MKEVSKEVQTIKVRVKTHDDLKVLAALRKQSILDTLEQLVQADLLRIEEEKRKRTNASVNTEDATHG